VSRCWITGLGAVGPGGIGREGLRSRSAADRLKAVPPGLPLKEGFPPRAVRWLDASSLTFVHAARQALLESGESDPGGLASVVGLGWGSNPPVHHLVESIHREGFSGMNPGLFPYSVGNAPAAQAGILLGVKGPSMTLNGKEASGLAALVEGCRILAAGAARGALAGAVDHLFPFVDRYLRFYGGAGHPPYGDGAYVCTLRGADEPPSASAVAVSAWASATEPCAPHRYPEGGVSLAAVVERVLERTGWDGASVDCCALPRDGREVAKRADALRRRFLPHAEDLDFQRLFGLCGASWCAAAQLAVMRIQEGRGKRAVLGAVSTGGGAWAIGLETAPP